MSFRIYGKWWESDWWKNDLCAEIEFLNNSERLDSGGVYELVLISLIIIQLE